MWVWGQIEQSVLHHCILPCISFLKSRILKPTKCTLFGGKLQGCLLRVSTFLGHCISAMLYLYTLLFVIAWKCLRIAPGSWRFFSLNEVHFVGFNLCDLLYEQSGLCGITVWKALYVLNDLNTVVHMCLPLIRHTLTCSVCCYPAVICKES